MTSVNVFKRFTLIALLMLGAHVNPALAGPPIPGPGIPAYDSSTAPNLNSVILGNPLGSNGSYPLVIGTNTPFGGAVVYSSLTEYFEKVWWPKFVQTNQIIGRENADLLATEMAHAGRIASAGDWVAHKAKVDELSWLNDAGFIGGEAVICPGATLTQSQGALEVLARMSLLAADSRTVADASGVPSAGSPTGSKGPSVRALQSVQQSNTAGTCFIDGNDGGNKEWCTKGVSGKADPIPPPGGFHLKATTILGQTGYVTDPKKENNATYAEMFLARLFPNRFSPIRPDLLNPLSTQAAEVIFQQEAYAAGLSTFMYPFNKQVSDSEPFKGISAQDYLKKALVRSGIPDSEVASFIGEGGVSKAGADKIIYLNYMRDPKTMMEGTTWDAPNSLRMIAITNMNLVSLLYEVREEQKVTNALLGALGSMLTRDLYDSIQARTAAISTR